MSFETKPNFDCFELDEEEYEVEDEEEEEDEELINVKDFTSVSSSLFSSSPSSRITGSFADVVNVLMVG